MCELPFNGTEYDAWVYRIRSVLKEGNLLKAIEEEGHSVGINNVKDENKAQAILIAGVTNSHLGYLKDQQSAYAMYQNLERNFRNKNVRSRLYLRRKLSEMKYNENTSLQEFFIKMEECFSQLKDANTEISDDEKINYILLVMPKSFESVVTAIETLEDLKLDFVKNRLLGEEEKRAKGSYYEARGDEFAFNCFRCGKSGHRQFQCWGFNRAKRGLSTNYRQLRGNFRARGRASNRARGRGMYASTNNSYLSTAQLPEEREHIAFMAYERGNIYEQNENEMIWYVDSGSSHHLVSTKRYFTDYIKFVNPIKINVAKKNAQLSAVGIGKINIKIKVGDNLEKCCIEKVYYVPEVQKNCRSLN